MRTFLTSVAVVASALALAGCHNPNPAKRETPTVPVGTAQIASTDAANCKPVACTPSGGLSRGAASGNEASSAGSAATGASARGWTPSARSGVHGRVATASSHRTGGFWSGGGVRHARAAETHRNWWDWRDHHSQARAPARATRMAADTHRGAQAWSHDVETRGWTRVQPQWRHGADNHGWTRVQPQPRQGWSRQEQYASGSGGDRRWQDNRDQHHGREAHYGYLDQPLNRGAYDERYTETRTAQAHTVTRYYSERRVVSPARVCAPGAWLRPDGRCVFAHRTAEVSVPASFFYDNGGVGSDVVSSGGGGGFIYGQSGGYGRSSAGGYASASAYASARASVHVRGGAHGGGHGGGGHSGGGGSSGCGCSGKH